MILIGCGLSGLYSIVDIREKSQVLFYSICLNERAPLVSRLMPANSLVTTCVVSLLSSVPKIFSIGSKSQVVQSIVPWIPVNVVDEHPIWYRPIVHLPNDPVEECWTIINSNSAANSRAISPQSLMACNTSSLPSVDCSPTSFCAKVASWTRLPDKLARCCVVMKKVFHVYEGNTYYFARVNTLNIVLQ